jgi:hypothetical protein
MKEYVLRHHFPKKSLQDMLGTIFEHTMMLAFPTLIPQQRSSSHFPDFYADEGFYIEAKTAFGGFGFSPSTGQIFKTDQGSRGLYGAQIKQYQIESFGQIAESTPVLYAIGFHGVYDSTSRFAAIKDKHNFIVRNFISPQILFCDNSFVNAIYQKEKRLSKRARAIHESGVDIPKYMPRWYMSLKRNLIEQAIEGVVLNEDILIKRRDAGINSSLTHVDLFSYYGISRDEYSAQRLGFAQPRFVFDTVDGGIPINLGYVVNRENEHKLLCFFKNNNVKFR